MQPWLAIYSHHWSRNGDWLTKNESDDHNVSIQCYFYHFINACIGHQRVLEKLFWRNSYILYVFSHFFFIFFYMSTFYMAICLFITIKKEKKLKNGYPSWDSKLQPSDITEAKQLLVKYNSWISRRYISICTESIIQLSQIKVGKSWSKWLNMVISSLSLISAPWWPLQALIKL